MHYRKYGKIVRKNGVTAKVKEKINTIRDIVFFQKKSFA